MSSQKKARGLPGMKEGPLVQMLNRQRVQQASADEAKKLVDTAAKSSVLSLLSGLENVVLNDFIDDELDSEDVSEQRASASLPDSVPIEWRKSVLHVKQMRWLRSMLSGIMRQTQMWCWRMCLKTSSSRL